MCITLYFRADTLDDDHCNMVLYESEPIEDTNFVEFDEHSNEIHNPCSTSASVMPVGFQLIFP